MAIAMSSLPNLFQALQALFGCAPWAPAARTQVRAPLRRPARVPAVRAVALVAPVQRAQLRPLRVVRVLEPSARRWEAGRMVISGRMADVCAELDRLAAHEARDR